VPKVGHQEGSEPCLVADEVADHAGAEPAGENIALGKGNLRERIEGEIDPLMLIDELGLRLDRQARRERDGIAKLKRCGQNPAAVVMNSWLTD
jgi:hypothetical protein